MKRPDDLNRGFGNSAESNSIKNGTPKATNPAHQKSLEEIGGEPLGGSGFENEEPEDGFSHAGEQS